MKPPIFDSDLLRRVEQFYYAEARMLDERRYFGWLALLSPDIRYVMPSHHVPQARPTHRDAEQIHAVAHELSDYGPSSLPIREEGFGQLAQRAERALKPNAWAENPPPRTRRFVMNVEVELLGGGDIRAYSNFQLAYSRHGRDNHLFTGQRRDRLLRDTAGFKIAEREVVLDWNVITGPSVALLF